MSQLRERRLKQPDWLGVAGDVSDKRKRSHKQLQRGNRQAFKSEASQSFDTAAPKQQQ